MVRDVDGIPLLNERGIIPFKAKAWLDLSARREAGEKVDERDIKKHRNDAARLLQLLPADTQYSLPDNVRDDMANSLRRSARLTTSTPNRSTST